MIDVWKYIKKSIPNPFKKGIRYLIFDLYKKLKRRSAEKIETCKHKIELGYAKKSYSMEGEDVFLEFLFGGKKDGFFVDVGAHHPFFISNTYFFYKKGWRGVNIDAMPGSMNLFNKIRPHDTNLELGISEKRETLIYYGYNKPEYNTFSKELKTFREQNENYSYLKVIFEKRIEVFSLGEILSTYVPKQKTIDFLSVDTEGMDLLVLRSNNWEKFRPRIILVECEGDLLLKDVLNQDVYKYLTDIGYNIIAKTRYDLIFESTSYVARL